MYGNAVPAAPVTMLMIRPRPRATMPPITAAAHSRGPRRFTVTSDHQRSGSTSQTGPNTVLAPALFTSTSTSPSDSVTRVIALATLSTSVTSAVTAITVPPAWPMRSATASISPLERASTATFAPATASAVAAASPIPRPPPVTTATRPSRAVTDPDLATGSTRSRRRGGPLRAGRSTGSDPSHPPLQAPPTDPTRRNPGSGIPSNPSPSHPADGPRATADAPLRESVTPRVPDGYGARGRKDGR